MEAYLEKIKDLLISFERTELKQFPKEENNHMDTLANIASVVHLVRKMTIEGE